MKRTTAALTILLLIATTQTATAIKARDVMNKMDTKERFSYLTGLVDMMAYSAFAAGHKTKSACVYREFYRNKKTLPMIYRAFDRWPDKQPEGIIIVLMNRACGK